MRIFNLFLFVFYLTFVFSCKSDEVSDDEYEIINLLVSQISSPLPPPTPISEDEKNLTEDEKVKIVEDLIKKDSIEKSKLNFTIYFIDSLKGLDMGFGSKLFEKNIGFDEFHLMKINNELMKSKKINLDKLTFPKNIKNVKNQGNDPRKWENNFLGHYWISRIIFNDEKNKAVLEFNHVCGHYCGGGLIIYLSKINGKWKFIQSNNSWVS